MVRRAASLAALLFCLPALAQATDVFVHVSTVDRKGGLIRADVCTREQFLKDCAHHGSAPAHPGEVVVLVPGVPPGVYSVSAYHDVNESGKVVQDAIGMPMEGVGFSRDPMLLFGAPGFAETALRIGGARVRVDVTLKFEP